MRRLNIDYKFEYPKDVRRIQIILLSNEIEATLKQCEELWNMYSESISAGWMNLPEDDDEVFSRIESYIL